MIRASLLALIALALGCLGGSATAQPLGGDHVKAELVAESTGATPGSTLYVAVVQHIERGWHTYWRNPGDAGDATRIAWTLPVGWRAGDIVWPAPKRLPVGPLMNYGYEGEVALPVPIEIPAAAAPGGRARIAAAVSMLVCAEVCVPQDATLTLDVPVAAGAAQPDPTWGPIIARTLAAAPKPSGLSATFQAAPASLHIAVAGPALAGKAAAGAYFFPYDGRLIDQPAPQTLDLGERGLTLAAAPGPIWRRAPIPGVVQGVLATADGAAFEISATPGPPPPGAAGLGPPAAVPRLGLALAALFAFAGGLLLNLMPCVFPVLAMKAASLIRRPEEAAHGRANGLAFMAGVLAAFLALALAVIAARAAGEGAGWGAQLQPPWVTGALALVMLAAALDLSGVYEVGTALQGLGSGLAGRAGLLGAAFTGALAVVVATPCTAPFMGPALGYAFTQPPAVALTIFVALGFGFALPFTALAFSPGLRRRLARPGPWMDVVKQALAFPMYGAAAWLAWVLAQQADSGTLAALLAAAVLLGLALWILGAAQRQAAAGGRARLAYALAGAFGALTIGALVTAPYAQPPTAGSPAVIAGVTAEPWSPDRVASLRLQGRPIFVDFTAAWCVSCKVNEQVALNTREAAEAFRRTGAAFLKADWTRRDPAIAKALADEGRVGVPLYLVYGADGGAPKVLPQLLTAGLVAHALDEAAKPPP